MKKTLTLLATLFAGIVSAQSIGLDWAKSMGSYGGCGGYSIAIDNAGNSYTTGKFMDTVDFDPGPGVHNLIALGTDDGFILKLDATGNFIWAKQFGGASSQCSSQSIAVDTSGNIYTAGWIRGTIDFDPGAGIFNLASVAGFINANTFVTKLDASGNFVWAKSINSDSTAGSEASSIALDAQGNSYTTGFFGHTDDFDPGAGVYNMTASSDDIFILKLDAAGNFMWAKQMGGPGIDIANSITIDKFGNVCTTGQFADTADFDPGAGVYNLISNALHLRTGQIFLYPN